MNENFLKFPHGTSLKAARLDQFLGYHIRRTSKAIQADLSKTLMEFDLRMITFSALLVIEEFSGLRQSQFAEILEIERPNMAVIVDELENKNWINKEKTPSDKRAYALSLTPEGRAVLQEASKAVEAHEARLFRGISPEDSTHFRSILELITTNYYEGKL